jgi:signal transduction histidine kinase
VLKLRWHLVQVLLFGILPIGLFAAALLYFHWRAQDAERSRMQIETARLLAAAVDNELDSTVRRLNILARLATGKRSDTAQFYEHAVKAVEASPDWALVLATTSDGEVLFRTDRPLGTRVPAVTQREWFNATTTRLGATVSDLFLSPISNQKVLAIGVPVVENGKVKHVLAASLNLHWFDELLRKQGLPPGGIGGIFDSQHKFVARSHDGDARRGTDPAPELHKRMLVEREGIGRFPSLDNTYVYTSWRRTQHGWWVAFATPAAAIDGAFWRYLSWLGGLLAAVVLAGLAFAALKGRRITASLGQLEQRTAALAQGTPLPPGQSSEVAEINHALQALERASALLAKAREERDLLLEAEQHGRAAAEQANQAKDEFLAMLGHELRNPLAAVSNAAAIIRSGERTPQQLEFAAGVLHRQTAHLKRLIDDLLDVGRVMTGKILLDRRPLDLQASVRHVVSTLQTAGTFANHRLEMRAAPAWINGDQTRIEQIVSNLLVNAAAYSPAGGEILVALAEEDGQAVLRVSDKGQGIREEHLSRIFDLFFQAEPSRTRSHSGLGIGLTLVKRLVELHGGSVAAESNGPGQGASFTVKLPATVSQSLRADSSPPRSVAPRTVLLVEDNVDERETLRVALELHGHRVLQAGDARSALEQIRSGHPSIALIDIGLPGMDGYHLAREIHSSVDGKKPVLIALTGYGSAEDARRASDAGFVTHLTKPVEVSELAAIVSRAVS